MDNNNKNSNNNNNNSINNNNKDFLFFKIWKNKYIKTIIFKYLKIKQQQQQYYNDEILENRIYYNYYQLKNVDLMSINNKGLLRDKVKNSMILKFTFDSNKIPFQEIFKNFKKNSEKNKEFYFNLFKNYSKYFINDIDNNNNNNSSIINSTAFYITLCDCVVAFDILIKKYNFKPILRSGGGSKNKNKNINWSPLYYKSILVGSINIANYLKDEIGCILSEDEKSKIYYQLINIDYSNKNYKKKIILYGAMENRNKSIHFLNSIKISIPPQNNININNNDDDNDNDDFTSLIDFSVKNKTLEFCLNTCYSIIYLKELFKNYKFVEFVNKSKEAENVILSIEQLDKFRDEQQLQRQLNCLVKDLDCCNQSFRSIVRMSIFYTSSLHLRSNLMFCNAKFDNNYFPEYSHKKTVRLALGMGDYKKLKSIGAFQSLNNLSQFNIPKYPLFGLLLKNPKHLESVKSKFIDSLINDYFTKLYIYQGKIEVIIMILIINENIDLIQFLINHPVGLLENNIKIQRNHFKFIKSQKMFNFLLSVNLIEIENLKLIKPPPSQQQQQDQPQQQPICNPINWEKKVNIYYLDETDNYDDNKNDSINPFLPMANIPLWKFIIIVSELTPIDMQYSCLNSKEKLKWVLENRQDVDSKRCFLIKDELSNSFGIYDSFGIEKCKTIKIFNEIIEYYQNIDCKEIDSNNNNNIIYKFNEFYKPTGKMINFIDHLFFYSVFSDIIKRCNFETLDSFLNFIMDKRNQDQQSKTMFLSKLLQSIGELNALEVFSHLFTNHSNLFTQDDYLNCYIIASTHGSIELKDFILKNSNINLKY
ncbi:hypothetical protein DDB_G0278093 [Dictyostelium discoideum AX4]|uniref:Uncharacterized protein n=1 Tax=Dictyostelium discoideum TaxID=44689 RepID=Q54YT5_DICDI|nr:hypothetical protein DDB_G0278093 [Dictyostelium discoideum AX4]EAL68219.2 hypothetical protein DDB_G0278093 [Dictyostelium discoideum AX4]|eukprot:XP_642117.2 hypothetical protein DDB_G0278093 [Dictyostelium discoideum AX4]